MTCTVDIQVFFFFVFFFGPDNEFTQQFKANYNMNSFISCCWHLSAIYNQYTDTLVCRVGRSDGKRGERESKTIAKNVNIRMYKPCLSTETSSKDGHSTFQKRIKPLDLSQRTTAARLLRDFTNQQFQIRQVSRFCFLGREFGCGAALFDG